jgi:hypothetical protein
MLEVSAVRAARTVVRREFGHCGGSSAGLHEVRKIGLKVLVLVVSVKDGPRCLEVHGESVDANIRAEFGNDGRVGACRGDVTGELRVAAVFLGGASRFQIKDHEPGFHGIEKHQVDPAVDNDLVCAIVEVDVNPFFRFDPFHLAQAWRDDVEEDFEFGQAILEQHLERLPGWLITGERQSVERRRENRSDFVDSRNCSGAVRDVGGSSGGIVKRKTEVKRRLETWQDRRETECITLWAIRQVLSVRIRDSRCDHFVTRTPLMLVTFAYVLPFER